MDLGTNTIPVELTYLEATYQAVLGNPQAGMLKTASPDNSFYVALWFSSKTYRESQNKAIHLRLAKYWLYKFNKTLELVDKLEFAKQDIFNLIRCIVEHKLVEHLIQDETTARALAFVCITAVPLRISDEGPCHTPIEELVQQWMGSINKPSVITSISEAVDIFYGPAASLLYTSEVEQIDKLPTFMKNSGMPLVGLIRPESNLEDKDLPLDLI